MDKFRTNFVTPASSMKINHGSKIMMLGSCFTENIGNKLERTGFEILTNPFGILFNPSSIETCLSHIIRNQKFSEKDFFKHNEQYHSFLVHSRYSSSDLKNTVTTANKQIAAAHQFFFNTDVLIISLGSAWVYEHKASGKVVANCHKVPAIEFEKKKLGINDIISGYSHLLQHLKSANEKLQIIFTISPVRHLKDGFVENNWSKSTLNIAVHELVRRFEFVDYFPAYEIMMDDLRDYRFYKDDMLHPSDLAIEYTWNTFLNTYADKTTRDLCTKFESLQKALEHRPFNSGTESFQKFILTQVSEAENLSAVNQKLAGNISEELKRKLVAGN